MLSANEQVRYSRQIMLPEIGAEGQERLKAAKVLIIGAGGLGCPVILYLAAAGVGTIGIVDSDVVEESNLQRQILYSIKDVGQLKCVVAKKRAEAVNNNITIKAYDAHANAGNILRMVSDYDIVVDGTDNFSSRYLINDACVMAKKPLVFGSIFKFEGQVSVFNYDGGPTYRCVFPKVGDKGAVPNCATIGVVATLPGIVGTLQANEVIKIITNAGEVLSGKLLVIDVLKMRFKTFEFDAIEENRHVTTLVDDDNACDTIVREIAFADLGQETQDFILVDVRETREHDSFNIGGINLPLSNFEGNIVRLDESKNIVVYCASGVRSRKAAGFLLRKGFKNVVSIRNGISHLIPAE